MRSCVRSRVALALLLAATAAGCGEHAHDAHDDHAHDHGGEAEPARGPNGGRLFEDGDFALELAIFERGVPPEYRAWVRERGEPIAPAEIDLEVDLHRFGGRVDRIGFAPAGAFLRGDRTVDEPHSFEVRVVARRGGAEHRFSFDSLEGRAQVSADAARVSGIRVEAAGPATIREEIVLHGRVEPDGDRTAHVTPRFPGVVLEARKRLGDAVAANEVVAVVESNESLRPYEVRARIAGTVIEKAIVPGEFVAADAPIYVVSDLSRVWVDLRAHRRDFARLAVGQQVAIEDPEGGEPLLARIDYLAALGAPDSQSLLARAVAGNEGGRLRPGLFVTARVTVREIAAPVAVRSEALQRFRDWDVVFRADGDLYEVQPLELGAADGEWTEVRAGLAAGDAYAAAGSFVLKADVGKSGASHDH